MPERTYTKLQNHTLPDTNTWRQWGSTFDLAGASYRKAEIASYLQKAIRADQSDEPHGLALVREPDNPHDHNAIAVHGWVGSPNQSAMIGYIPAEIATSIAEIPDMPVACKLYGVKTNNDYIDVILILMIPGKRDHFWNGRDDFPL